MQVHAYERAHDAGLWFASAAAGPRLPALWRLGRYM